jgi:type I restriction enzyme R subunit
MHFIFELALSPEEQEEWDNLDWDEDGNPPDQVGAAAINKWLFNKDTVDKVLAHLMTRGLKVAGGDRLGKTIIFAKNKKHANFIAERFNINYPHYKGEFARVIHNEILPSSVQSLIDDFSKKDKAPHIAISVDMLDTGIDVPEVVNLVLFKMVHSRTKFWQMLGRGTRRCPDLFGLAQDKEFFYLFDYWALVQCNCEAETLTRQGINREHEVEAVLPKLALFAEYQERQQELVES